MQALVMLLSGDRAVLPYSIQHLLLTEKELVVFLDIAQSGPCVVVMVYVHDTPLLPAKSCAVVGATMRIITQKGEKSK